jgi:hypothetical protein
MITIKEGSLLFTFKSSCYASKYDDWVFYKKQFQKVCKLNQGIKAVDILAYYDDTLWFIEIKDYRQNTRTKTIDLADEVAKKVFDSLSGLIAAQCNANDSLEKNFAKVALNMSTLKVVLHLEQPRKNSKLFPKAIDEASVLSKLKVQLKAIDPHPKILDKSTTSSKPWSVS